MNVEDIMELDGLPGKLKEMLEKLERQRVVAGGDGGTRTGGGGTGTATATGPGSGGPKVLVVQI